MKAGFRYSQRATDININTLHQVLYLRLPLHNYCVLQKEEIPEQGLALALSFEERVQSATSSLSFKRFLNGKKTTNKATLYL